MPLSLLGGTLDEVISVLERAESGGNPSAIGDGGKAFGILQIHEIAVEDYNRIYKTEFRHPDVFEPNVARQICKGYILHYTKGLQNISFKDCCFLWNGGPNGLKYSRDPNYGNPEKRQNLERYYKRAKTFYFSQK